MRTGVTRLLVVVGLTIVCGCSTVRTLVDPLNLAALGKQPVRVGITQLEFSPPPLMLPKRSLFQDNLTFHLKELVSLDLMTARQIRVHLGTGRLKFAMLSPCDFSEVAGADTCRILAVPINEHGQTYRKGLIVVSAKSSVHSVSELKGKRFHFMPRGDVLNEAARGVLADAGVDQSQIDKGVLGLGLDTYHINSLTVAKSVVLEENEHSGGVIDEAEYQKWKPTGGSLLLLAPSQDEVRVIGETVRVPEGPIVVGSTTPPELTEKVHDYLINVLPKRKLVLAPMGYRGFAEPVDVKEYEPFFAVHRKVHHEEPTSRPAPVDEAGETDLPPSH